VNDAVLYRISQSVLRGEFAWLEQGIVPPGARPAASVAAKRAERPEPVGAGRA
jgi:hypothetical protein